MGADEVREVMARRKVRDFDPGLARITGTYRFDIQGVGVWRVRVDRGRVVVHEGTGDADCIVRCSPDDFVRLARGEQNLVTAFMQGRVEIEGDLALAQALHGILPSPRPAAQEEARP